MALLRPYQAEAVKEILDKKRVLIADDMGLGKCAESICAKTEIDRRYGEGGKTLIICPPSVVQHWEDEIKLWYHKHEDTKIARVETSTYDSNIKSARNADFVVVGYPTLSYFGDQAGKVGKLNGLGFQYGIIDEAHNAKNPESIRSSAARKLLHTPEYLAILSGTPIPNTVIDIYSLLNLLDKESFPINSENARSILTNFYTLFRRDPEFVSRVIGERRIRRTVEDYLNTQFPAIQQHDLEVMLNGEHQDVYMNVYENDEIKPGSKLIQLRKAALDPNIVNPKKLEDKLALRVGKMESSVYKSVDDIIEEAVDKGGKVLLFSDLKVGVTDKLTERYAKYGAVFIDSDVPSTKTNRDLSLREEVRRRFQQDPNCKVLIATTVMDEGVDLTAATDIVHLTLPYSPAAMDQRNRRSQRIGEVKKDSVNVYTVKQKLDTGIPTITEGIGRLLDDKRRIITYIEKEPFSLTKRDLDEIKNGKPQKSSHLAPIIRSGMNSVLAHFRQLKGQGHKKILAHYEKYPEEAEYIARLYASHWEGYYGGNTANLYTKVIQLLGETEDLERKLDIASGPFSLSRKLGEPVTNIDLNPHMLQAGRKLEEKEIIVPGNIAKEASFHDLPFDKESFDLAVCSLALHMSRLEVKDGRKTIKERELVFKEANRILRPGGYGIITLPYTAINLEDTERFYEGLEQLGFEVLPFSGFYKGPKESKFKRVYLAGLRKIEDSPKASINPELLTWKMDKNIGERKGSSKKKKKHILPEERIIEKEHVTSFLHTTRRKELWDLVKESLE